MRWKSSRISASTCFGAFRSRLRSLWTQQRWIAARGHTRPTARRSPALPSMMASTGARKPRDEIVEADFPCRERLASAQFQGEQMFVHVEEDAELAPLLHAYF